ncbi:unnamed protein product [Medioppia subpectinata]|uniref:Eukaryotic peptide chain release factor subunit 1 n=1 Tax=Medioppia subpectinata TaxID=1979941 RepID=A0A7R9PW16_9ACAR|nr:unnamed protein product [Medioppia subpectinata]CAG2102403.1 unnamed protein product [Medioppia subpectinata]
MAMAISAGELIADQNVKIWKIKKLIKSLESARGNGTSMISLIIPTNGQISRVSRMLVDESGTAANIKSRVNRLSVQSAIISVQHRLKLYSRVPANGLVIYCGTVITDEGKEKKVNIDFEPFKPINRSLYLCDNRFHTEKLSELLVEENRFGFIVVDGNGALFGILEGNSRQVIRKFAVDLPKKHGQDAAVSRRCASHVFGSRRDTITSAKWRKRRHNCLSLKISPMSHDSYWLEVRTLRPNSTNRSSLIRLRAKVVKLVDVSYGGESGFNEAINLCGEVLSGVKFIEEKKLMDRYFNEISQDTGKYCFGVENTFTALEMSAVEVLIVWENLDIIRHELKNPNTDERRVLHVTPRQEKDRKLFADNETGVEWEQLESMSLLEWLANNYTKFGAILEIVSDSSQEGSQFVKGFGGIGAILRYEASIGYIVFTGDGIGLHNVLPNDSDSSGQRLITIRYKDLQYPSEQFIIIELNETINKTFSRQLYENCCEDNDSFDFREIDVTTGQLLQMRAKNTSDPFKGTIDEFLYSFT